ncbi:integrin alpha [Nitrosomonas sp. Nm166]|uniref:integrin alpha n=1 Tax=Nitrosomonas sp. Nm166 TaxID=1881054 RepID=UPI0008E27592|nr:FG-GAP repeat-containing protein [Nitrosomonas sp. Nm166]
MTTTVIDLSSLDGNNGFRLDGVAAYDYSGRSVSNAGDVNGDGFDDVIVGASFADPNGIYSGSSYVIFGKASGFNAALELSSLDGNSGFRLDGVAEDDQSGRSVSSAGDVNGDGFDDVIIGAPNANQSGGGYNSYAGGASYVVFGKASGFDAALSLSSLDGSNGFRLDGRGDARSGGSVSSAGDVNNDGFDDMIIGAFGANPNGDFSGSSFVVFGKASGFDATLDLSNLDGRNGFRLDGVAEDDQSGRSVSSAGDVNGDGFDDVIIGADGADPNGKSSGSSYVVFGKNSGFDATIDLSSLDGSNGFRLDGWRKMTNRADRLVVRGMLTVMGLMM